MDDRAPRRKRRRRLSRAALLAAGVLGVILLSSVAGPRPRPTPLAPGTLTPGQHLRRRPLRPLGQDALPGPGQVAVGRFLFPRGLANGPRARGRPGDYFLRNAQLLAVIAADGGRLVDLALAPDFVDRISWGRVVLCGARGRREVALRDVRIVSGPRAALQLLGVDPLDPTLQVTTTYALAPAGAALEVTTELENRGDRPVVGVAVCDQLALGNTRLQVAGHGEARWPGTVTARSCGRSEDGTAYAYVAEREAELRLDFDTPRPAFAPDIDATHARLTLVPAGRWRVRRALAASREPYHVAHADALRTLGTARRAVTVRLAGRAPGDRLWVLRDGRPYLVSAARAAELALQLPRAGAYAVALERPGAGLGPVLPIPARASPTTVGGLAPPPTGRLALEVLDESGRPAAAKLVLEGSAGTPTPALGDEGLALDNVVYAPRGAAELALAPGSYAVTATRGPEHELGRATVVVRAGVRATVRLRAPRAVSSPGWISADLHVHTSSSTDSPHDPATRLGAALAVGLELVVATEHNAVADYRAVAAQPPFVGRVIVVPGEEVTTGGPAVGHFNVFPLAPRELIAAGGTSPAGILAAARRAGSGVLVQLNHPRMSGIGTFDLLGYDPRTGRARSPLYRDGYQLLEVFNGDHLAEPAAVDAVVADWFALLDRGLRVVATGNSDTHRLPYQDAGAPRNLVLWDTTAKTDDDAARATPARVLAALAAGRVVVSTGPLVRFTANGQPVGSTVASQGRAVALRIVVEAPSWIDVRHAILVANGAPLATLRATSAAGGRRLDVTRSVRPTVDTWYAVIVRGAAPDPTQQRPGVLPYALTNPIWVDADGDGRFTPPRGPASRPAGRPASGD